MRNSLDRAPHGAHLIIDKGYIGAGVDLITCDDKGNLICSSTIAGREEKGKIHYWFLINRNLVKSTTITLFAKNDEMLELHLGIVRILPKSKG
jgi:hypothetical protein